MMAGRILGRQGLGVSKVPRALLSAAIITGCSSLIGIDDAPPASECVRNQDCATGFTCEDFRCVSSVGGEGGEAGAARAGTGGKGGSAGSGAGGGGGAAGDDGGAAGTGPTVTGGKSGSGGRGGTAGHAGEEGGAGGEPQGEVGGGGEGREGPVDKCEVSRCLSCDGDGNVVPRTECEHACNEIEGCIIPKSCNGLSSPCGSNVSCCLSYPVIGGSFARSCDATCGECDATYPATVNTFQLDVFEVNVGRFRAFVSAYASALPSTGLGSNPHNADDVGWREEWNIHLPATQEDLVARITSPDCAEPHTWTETDVGTEDYPINCVSWYVAQAFCIWDGGRLPTQAEWNYAAAGGDEQRLYPWSVPRDSSILDETYAVFTQDGPQAVGQRLNSRGKWLQHDLAGNLWEWVFDDHEKCYTTPGRCDNCGIATATPIYKTARGGGYFESGNEITSAARNYTEGEYGYSDYGFRCARDL